MRPLRHILATESTLAGFVERRRRELSVLQRLQDNLPPALAAQVDVADARPPELVLIARTGAAAGLVRQRVPTLLQILAHEGWEFTGILVRVQARSPPQVVHKSVEKQLDGISAAVLRRRALEVADPALAAALRRLADQSAEGASGSEQEPLEGVKNQHAE
jgi:hypothetical protein